MGKGAVLICEALKTNTNLSKLDMWGNEKKKLERDLILVHAMNRL